MAKPATTNVELQKLIELGKEKGFLTYDEINDALPNEGFSADEVDGLLEMLGEMGIDVVDSAEKARSSEEPAEEKEKVWEVVGIEDPVRVYMKEMGAVSLLTREEEVVLAKEIEDGRNELKRFTLGSPFASREVLRISERVKTDKASIRELMEEVDETIQQYDEESVTEVLTTVDKLKRRKIDGAYKILKDLSLNPAVINRIVRRVTRLESLIEREESKRGSKKTEKAKKRIRWIMIKIGMNREGLRQLAKDINKYDIVVRKAKKRLIEANLR